MSDNESLLGVKIDEHEEDGKLVESKTENTAVDTHTLQKGSLTMDMDASETLMSPNIENSPSYSLNDSDDGIDIGLSVITKEMITPEVRIKRISSTDLEEMKLSPSIRKELEYEVNHPQVVEKEIQTNQTSSDVRAEESPNEEQKYEDVFEIPDSDYEPEQSELKTEVVEEPTTKEVSPKQRKKRSPKKLKDILPRVKWDPEIPPHPDEVCPLDMRDAFQEAMDDISVSARSAETTFGATFSVVDVDLMVVTEENFYEEASAEDNQATFEEEELDDDIEDTNQEEHVQDEYCEPVYEGCSQMDIYEQQIIYQDLDARQKNVDLNLDHVSHRPLSDTPEVHGQMIPETYIKYEIEESYNITGEHTQIEDAMETIQEESLVKDSAPPEDSQRTDDNSAAHNLTSDKDIQKGLSQMDRLQIQKTAHLIPSGVIHKTPQKSKKWPLTFSEKLGIRYQKNKLNEERKIAAKEKKGQKKDGDTKNQDEDAACASEDKQDADMSIPVGADVVKEGNLTTEANQPVVKIISQIKDKEMVGDSETSDSTNQLKDIEVTGTPDKTDSTGEGILQEGLKTVLPPKGNDLLGMKIAPLIYTPTKGGEQAYIIGIQIAEPGAVQTETQIFSTDTVQAISEPNDNLSLELKGTMDSEDRKDNINDRENILTDIPALTDHTYSGNMDTLTEEDTSRDEGLAIVVEIVDNLVDTVLGTVICPSVEQSEMELEQSHALDIQQVLIEQKPYKSKHDFSFMKANRKEDQQDEMVKDANGNMTLRPRKIPRNQPSTSGMSLRSKDVQADKDKVGSKEVVDKASSSNVIMEHDNLLQLPQGKKRDNYSSSEDTVISETSSHNRKRPRKNHRPQRLSQLKNEKSKKEANQKSHMATAGKKGSLPKAQKKKDTDGKKSSTSKEVTKQMNADDAKKSHKKVVGGGRYYVTAKGQVRLRPGVKALHEIKMLRLLSGMICRKKGFKRFVQFITDEFRINGEYIRMSPDAFEALQEAGEAFMVDYFRASMAATLHAKRQSLMIEDMKLVACMRGDLFMIQFQHAFHPPSRPFYCENKIPAVLGTKLYEGPVIPEEDDSENDNN